MDWQESIIQRLNLREKSAKIVLDETGILLNEQFTGYLTRCEVRFSFAKDVTQILEALRAGILILTGPIELPDYLSARAEIIYFDLKRLPINVESKVISKLTVTEVIQLIEYQVNLGDLSLIKESNYPKILEKARHHFLNKQIDSTASKISDSLSRINNYDDLLELAGLWGQYIFLCFQDNMVPNTELMQHIDNKTEIAILDGMLQNAFYAPVSTPKTVDKILPFLKCKHQEKTALICFDGMGLAEWFVLKEFFLKDFQFDEKAIFALIPTMTQISRFAIFSGDIQKAYSGKAVNEDKEFKEYFSKLNTASFRDGEINSEDKLLGIDFVKIIYNFFDDIAHNTVLPSSEQSKNLYFQNIKNYLQCTTIKNELKILLKAGFNIWICSDHGTVLATGSGQKIDAYLIEKSCRRATLINRSDLAKFYDANSYDIPFIKNKIALLAKNRTAFTFKNRKEITHGGITLEELVVPFTEVLS